MPIANMGDAFEVGDRLDDILSEGNEERRVGHIRSLFVETLDWQYADGLIPLQAARDGNLPSDARLVASRDGTSVVYVALTNADTDRITAAAVNSAARSLGDTLSDDLLLLFANRRGDQFHIIRPDLSHARPRLQRMVARHGEHHRTVVQQIANMWDDYGRNGKTVREAIVAAFSVEPVTKRFFAEYRRVFEDAKNAITGFEDERELHLFTQTLFNRLMFVYFVSRKGWLHFDDDTDYLNALWRDYESQRTSESNFNVDRLRLLFFAGLNNPKSEDLTEYPDSRRLIGTVPFLNGGLFEETGMDARSDIYVSDAVILSILRDLFDPFNFTVMESTPYDTEVAVDPEMLGKVFEELVNERNESGAYYTPRPVVSFMCREALKGFLSGAETGLSDDVISEFVDTQKTQDISVAAARKVAAALERVTVVDPACGSGAYLLGMMQELVDLQTTLFNVGVDAKSLYDLKLEIIRRNLYGADIDNFAVNIAMLRLWLSLVIEYEGDEPEPLPNLDFKIACGDSLLAPDPDPQKYGDFTAHLMRESEVTELKANYMRARTQIDKDGLRAKIAKAQVQIGETLRDAGVVPNAIDWRVEFAEVMGDGGFDIVVANPPYVQLQKDSSRLGRLYRNAGYETFAARGDIYQLFYERGCQMLKSSAGVLAYITSNSWLKAEYGKTTRSYFAEKHTPLTLLELGKDVFESAIVDSSVLMVREGMLKRTQPVFDAVDVEKLESTPFPPDRSQWGQVRLDGDAPWSILLDAERSAMDKMRAVGTPLREWDVSINYGIKTGYNKAFIIDTETKNALVAADAKSAEIIKPVLRGRDIQRFQAQWSGQWLIVAKYGIYKTLAEEFPAIYRHLLQHEERLRLRGQCRYSRSATSKPGADYPGQHHWLELDNNPKEAYLELFAKEKLLWIELVESGRFAYDNSGIYGEATTFMLTGEDVKYLCAVMNSTLIRWFLQQIAPTSGMGTLRWKKVYVETIPIPKVSIARQRPFIALVDKILTAKAADPQADTSELEEDIDWLVYDLYGLTDEETAIIADAFWEGDASEEEEDVAMVRAIEEGLRSEPIHIEEVKSILRERHEVRN